MSHKPATRVRREHYIKTLMSIIKFTSEHREKLLQQILSEALNPNSAAQNRLNASTFLIKLDIDIHTALAQTEADDEKDRKKDDDEVIFSYDMSFKKDSSISTAHTMKRLSARLERAIEDKKTS